MELNLPNELIRLIQSFVISDKVSWRAEYHYHKLNTQISKRDFDTKWKVKQHNFCLTWERHEHNKILTFNSYDDDYISIMYSVVNRYYLSLQNYLVHYKKKIFMTVWEHGLCYVLGEYIQGTLSQELYFNQLRTVAQKHVIYINNIKEWNGCLTKEDYITMCLLQKYII
jgi:hypothetical protein